MSMLRLFPLMMNAVFISDRWFSFPLFTSLKLSFGVFHAQLPRMPIHTRASSWHVVHENSDPLLGFLCIPP